MPLNASGRQKTSHHGYESPVVKSAVVSNPALESLRKFVAENPSIATIGKDQFAVQKMLGRDGYK